MAGYGSSSLDCAVDVTLAEGSAGRGPVRERRVGVSPPEGFERHRQLFSLLEQAFPVRFHPRPADQMHFGNGNLVIGDDRSPVAAAATTECPCLSVAETAASPDRPRNCRVDFGDDDSVPSALLGSALQESQALCATRTLQPTASDSVLAKRDGVPLWIARRDARGSRVADVVAMPLPAVTGNDYLCDHFGRRQFASLLPLIDFVQRITRPGGWQPPPPRACIVFDDANMRLSRYGCLNLDRLVEHTRKRGYSAAIAIIPLDATAARSRVAELFRDNPQQLSLIIHGNDHEPLELARARPADDRRRLLAQARLRVRAFCERHGLPFAAIMEPPYGTMLADYFSPLDELGYEAVLVTPRQFRSKNRSEASHRTIGMSPAEVLSGGLSMIPRITADDGWKADVRLAAFLGQPIVFAGHHYDADDGMRFIDEVVDFVNGVARASWMSPAEIARTQVMLRREGARLRVRCFGRHVRISIPDGVRDVVIERPWIPAERTEALDCRSDDARWHVALQCSGESPPIAARQGAQIEVRSPRPEALSTGSLEAPRTALRLRVRRALAECRDRAYPLLPRQLRRKSKISRL